MLEQQFISEGDVRARLDRLEIEVIAANCGIGGRDGRSGLGPAALRAAGLEARLRRLGVTPRWRDIAVDEARDRAVVIIDMCRRVAAASEASARRGRAALVLGGDHSCAIGTWSGIANALHPKGPLGLIWIDAHLDSHTPLTSPSGNWHGMPLAHLLGHGHRALTSLSRHGPALLPQHLCLIGGRSYEPEEPALLSALGVRAILKEELDRRGLEDALTEALAIATDTTAGFGVSVDIDAVDPSEAPGVGSPEAGGMRGDDLIEALAGVARMPRFTALEIVEFNPARDREGRTARLMGRLLDSAYKERQAT